MTAPLMPADALSPARPALRGVIVEGPDCAGKTRLTQLLKEALSGQGWDVRQMGHRAGDQFKRYMTVYLDAERLLLDRSHFSEIVYGDLLRGGQHFSPAERALLDTMAYTEFVTVLCVAPPDLLRARHLIRAVEKPHPSPMTTAFDETVRRHLNDRQVVRAQERFVETLAQSATFVCESLSEAALAETARAVLDRLIAAGVAGDRTHAMREPHTPEFILVEGLDRAARAACAAALQARLPAWHISTLAGGVDAWTMHGVIGRYLCGRRTIFDGGHFTHQAIRSAGERFDEPIAGALGEIVARRGAVVLCDTRPDDEAGTTIERRRASPDDRGAHEYLMLALERAGVQAHVVLGADAAAMAATSAAIFARLFGDPSDRQLAAAIDAPSTECEA